ETDAREFRPIAKILSVLSASGCSGRAMRIVRYLLPSLTCVLATILGVAHAQDVIRIGELNSYKTQPAFLGPYRMGMELAIEQVNAAGGVNGRKLELII